jgi:FkbM family methyltransferase
MSGLLSLYIKVIIFPFKILSFFTGKNYIFKFLNHLKSKHPMEFIVDSIKFAGDEVRVAGRGRTLKEKEPDTIAWIEKYIKEGDVFYDIGANVGTFSLYAAKNIKNIDIYAFEPESSNYYFLNKNIYLNQFDSKISALNLALNDEMISSKLNLKEFVAGSSANNFHENLDQNHEVFSPCFRQGVLGMSLDDLIKNFNVPVPNHLKIDVDGNEYKIIRGMEELLTREELKSIAIELNDSLEKDREIVDKLIQNGFKQVRDEALINKRYKGKNWPYNRYFVRESLA